MVLVTFDGQQSGERILYQIDPHPMAKYLALTKLVALVVLFYLFLLLIATVVPFAGLIKLAGLLISMFLLLGGFWWIAMSHGKSKTFITDRRIIRFEVVTPFVTAKRELFWNEALKAKGFAPGFLYRLLGIGTVVVEPHLSTTENVRVTDVGWYEDIANYIDKILFTFKNKPAEIANIHAFVPKPRGERG